MISASVDGAEASLATYVDAYPEARHWLVAEYWHKERKAKTT